MVNKIITLFFVAISFTVISCSKNNSTSVPSFKEDPNNYFIATFNSKTLKSSGFLFNINGVLDDGSASFASLNCILSTSNTFNGVETIGILSVAGSAMNLAFGEQYKIPIQQLDVSLLIERIGNSVGSYKITDYNLAGTYTSSITDLTVGRKKYDFDPTTTTVNITSVDALYIQGNYSGKLIDGTSKIPVSGTFKLRKL